MIFKCYLHINSIYFSLKYSLYKIPRVDKFKFNENLFLVILLKCYIQFSTPNSLILLRMKFPFRFCLMKGQVCRSLCREYYRFEKIYQKSHVFNFTLKTVFFYCTEIFFLIYSNKRLYLSNYKFT